MRVTINIVFCFVSLILVFFTVTAVDRLLGTFLARRGFFTLMTPQVTEVYDTSEFSTIATISAQGLRNSLVSTPKPKGTFRILTLGDSFTWGWGVSQEESWPKILEKSLGSGVEVVNAGAPGMSIDTEIASCRIYKPWFEPDLILLGVYMTDDLYQIAAEDQLNYGPIGWIRERWPTITKLTGRVLMNSWHEGKSGATVTSSREWRRKASANLSLNPNLLRDFDPDMRTQYLEGKLNPSVVSFAVHAPNYLTTFLSEEARTQAFATYERYFRQFMKTCGKGVPVVVMVIPGDDLVSAAYHPYRQAEGYDVDSGLLTLDIDSPLRQIVENAGATFVSAAPSFRQDGCPDCYYPWDMHLTSTGHTRIAGELVPVVAKMVSL